MSTKCILVLAIAASALTSSAALAATGTPERVRGVIASAAANSVTVDSYAGKPVTAVRDPYGEHESFGAHNNARMRAFLDGFGFDYRFMSSTETYRSGRFDAVLLKMLARFDAIQAIMLPTLGEERRRESS